MNIFVRFLNFVGDLPDLVSLLVCPVLLLIAAILLSVFHKKGAYLPTAVGLGAAGFFLVLCKDLSSPAAALCYLALFALLAALLWALFLIPFPKGRRGADELYKKFALPLDTGEEQETAEAEVAEEECGLRLDHAASLIERLQQCELAASDRLEVDALSHTLEDFRGRALTAQEIRSVNDCLSTVLKLTAKYKL